MKKVSLLILLVMLVWPSLCLGEEVNTNEKPVVALMYVNNAKTTYDSELNERVMKNFDMLLNEKYIVVSGDSYIERLNKVGISDITTAEKADILDAFNGENADYILYCELQPFVRKEKISFFTQGIDMTAIIPIKIIDVKAGKYLYNGKFTEFASDSTMLGSVGNKSVSFKALNKTLEKMNSVISVRLPQTKNIEKQ